MSNVLRRNQTKSDMSYIDLARKIRVSVTSIVMNEKVIPKRYRCIFRIIF